MMKIFAVVDKYGYESHVELYASLSSAEAHVALHDPEGYHLGVIEWDVLP